MKKLVVLLSVVGMFGALPVFAADQHDHGKLNAQECVVLCAQRAQTLQDKIANLKGEVAKGNTAYSVEELRALEQKLKDAGEFLEMAGQN